MDFSVPAIPGGIVDAHVHARQGEGWRTDDPVVDLVTDARRVGVSTVLTSVLGLQGYLATPTEDDLVAANTWAAEIATAHPEIAPVLYCSPDHIDLSLDLMQRHIADGPFVGVKLWIARKATDPALDPIVAYAAELGVPILQHAWYKTVGQLPGESDPADVAHLAARHPEATIQMAHLSGCGERGVLDIADLPNVVVDTCGGDPEDGMVEFALEHLGPDRILFGSDAPGRDFGIQLSRILAVGLPDDQLHAILAGNARRLYTRLPQLTQEQ